MLALEPGCDINMLDLWVTPLGPLYKNRLEFLLLIPGYSVPLAVCRNTVHFKINYNYEDSINQNANEF